MIIGGRRLKSAPAPAAALIVFGCGGKFTAASAETSTRSMFQPERGPHPQNYPTNTAMINV
jgi:hypothetical protein